MVRDEEKSGLFVFLSWTFFLILITISTGYNGLYGLDSHEYLRYCNRLVDFIALGSAPGDYFWPVNYPLLGALLSFITGSQVALQLISIFGAAWIVYLMAMLLFREFPGSEREIIFYVIVFMGFAPYFLRYSISSMSDVPALAFACTAYYLLYLDNRSVHRLAIYFVLLFCSLAVFTRFALLPLVAPVALVCIYQMFKSFRPMLTLASLIMALVPFVIYLFFKQENSGLIFQHQLVSDWSVVNYFHSSFNNMEGYSQYTFPNIIFVLSFLIHPGFLFLEYYF